MTFVVSFGVAFGTITLAIISKTLLEIRAELQGIRRELKARP